MKLDALVELAFITALALCILTFYRWMLKQEELTECHLLMVKTDMKERGLE